MQYPISNNLISKLKKDHKDIIQLLDQKGYRIQSIPDSRKAIKDTGESIAIAYPIQGILKYHGFFNFENRIPFFPSISFCNNSLYTITYLKFDPALNVDKAYINGNQVFNHELERIKKALDYIREFSSIKTKALLISRNLFKYNDEECFGKGLGTSASGSAALALSAASILYNNNLKYTKNHRLISNFARYLSGSGCRSATGGISLWLTYPGIDLEDSFSIRLDNKRHQSFIKDISLITIPISSELKTFEAHQTAPSSPFYSVWLKNRKDYIIELIDALDNSDLNKIGALAEYDTICMHSMLITARKKPIFAFKPKTLDFIYKIHELRFNGYEVYFSIDTGPSLVLLTKKNQESSILKELKTFSPNYKYFKGNIGSSARILESESKKQYIIKNDMRKFLN